MACGMANRMLDETGGLSRARWKVHGPAKLERDTIGASADMREVQEELLLACPRIGNLYLYLIDAGNEEHMYKSKESGRLAEEDGVASTRSGTCRTLQLLALGSSGF